jgi:hypothetical protein
MSQPSCHAGDMKINKSSRITASIRVLPAGHRIIARFGVARLVKKTDGRHELIGGTTDDHTDAREWCSLFAPEVVFSGQPPGDSAVAFAG